MDEYSLQFMNVRAQDEKGKTLLLEERVIHMLPFTVLCLSHKPRSLAVVFLFLSILPCYVSSSGSKDDQILVGGFST